VLGDHVAQRGSLVAPDKLRFDFLHPKPISETELERVEDIANEIVIQNSPVVTQLMGVDDAIDSGARALFGEKYGDEVRVVSMGETPTGTNAMGWSVELCGGTHVERTGDIGLISIVGESGVASGVRRIEALTGAAARKNANTFIATANSVASVLHAPLAELAERASALLDERKKLERELSDVKKRLIMSSPALEAGDATMSGSAGMEVSGSGQLEAGNATMSGVVKVSPIVARVLNNIDAKELRPLVDDYKKRLGSGVVILVATNDGKASVAVGVVGKYSEANNAVDVVKAGAAILGGKGGGGRPDLALAGGPEIGKAQEALDAMRKMVRDPEGS
jgi:alanyl-tRNA synthetase